MVSLVYVPNGDAKVDNCNLRVGHSGKWTYTCVAKIAIGTIALARSLPITRFMIRKKSRFANECIELDY
jgi:hypothetical protein